MLLREETMFKILFLHKAILGPVNGRFDDVDRLFFLTCSDPSNTHVRISLEIMFHEKNNVQYAQCTVSIKGAITEAIIGAIITAIYFHKICKFKKLVSILAGMPGAFVVIAGAINQMTDSKKESGQVVIPQATRVLFIVLILPFVFVTQVGYQEIASHGNNPDYNLRYFLEIIFLVKWGLLLDSHQ